MQVGKISPLIYSCLLAGTFGIFGIQSASADDSPTLLIVHRQSGFIAAENSYRLECQVDGASTSRLWTKGRDTTVHEDSAPTQFTTKLKSIEETLAASTEAADGSMNNTTVPTDRPTSRYYGMIEGPAVDQYVKLLIDKSSVVAQNGSARTVDLLELANLNCPLP